MARGSDLSRRLLPHTSDMSYPAEEGSYPSSSSSSSDPRHHQQPYHHHQQYAPPPRHTSSPGPWSSYTQTSYPQSYEQTLPSTMNVATEAGYADAHGAGGGTSSYTRSSRSSYPTNVYTSSPYTNYTSQMPYHNPSSTMQRRPSMSVSEPTYYDASTSWSLETGFGTGLDSEDSKPNFPSSSSSSSSYHPYSTSSRPRAPSPPPPLPTTNSAPPPGPKSCAHCHTTTTPMWRREPQTARPLCNACGLYMQQRNMRRPQELIDADGPSPSTSLSPSSPSSSAPYVGPECSHCHTHITSVWRRNKAGDQVCNACGVYLRLKGKERPLDLAQKRNKIKPRLSKKETWSSS